MLSFYETSALRRALIQPLPSNIQALLRRRINRILEDGLKVATCIFEAAAWHYAVRVECRCRQEGLFEAHGLWWKFERKGWSDDFRDARRRFYCKACSQRYGRKVRPVIIETSNKPPRHCFPLPDEREWRRAVSRFRG